MVDSENNILFDDKESLKMFIKKVINKNGDINFNLITKDKTRWDSKCNPFDTTISVGERSICYHTINGDGATPIKLFFDSYKHCKATMISAIEGFGIYVYHFNNSDIDTDSCIEFYLDAGYKKKNVYFMNKGE